MRLNCRCPAFAHIADVQHVIEGEPEMRIDRRIRASWRVDSHATWRGVRCRHGDVP